MCALQIGTDPQSSLPKEVMAKLDSGMAETARTVAMTTTSLQSKTRRLSRRFSTLGPPRLPRPTPKRPSSTSSSSLPSLQIQAALLCHPLHLLFLVHRRLQRARAGHRAYMGQNESESLTRSLVASDEARQSRHRMGLLAKTAQALPASQHLAVSVRPDRYPPTPFPPPRAKRLPSYRSRLSFCPAPTLPIPSLSRHLLLRSRRLCRTRRFHGARRARSSRHLRVHTSSMTNRRAWTVLGAHSPVDCRRTSLALALRYGSNGRTPDSGAAVAARQAAPCPMQVISRSRELLCTKSCRSKGRRPSKDARRRRKRCGRG